jgi:hypothetical protein
MQERVQTKASQRGIYIGKGVTETGFVCGFFRFSDNYLPTDAQYSFFVYPQPTLYDFNN